MTSPTSEAGERAVLAGVMLAPERLGEVRGTVAPEDFAEERHAEIYSAMLAVADSGSTPDLRTVEAELLRRDLLDSCGGVAYLAGLDCDLPDLGRLERYAFDVADLARRRRIAEAAAKVAANGSDDGAVERLREALAESAPANGARVWTLAELLADPEAVELPEPLIPRLAWPGRATLLAAPEKLGKSTFLTAAVAALTTGRRWLGEETSGVGEIVLWATEEHPGDVARRLARYGADPASVVVMQWGADPVAEIRREAEARQAGAIVVDTLAAIAEHARPESGSASDWAAIMRPLVRLARDIGAALVILHHSRRADGAYRDSSEIGAAVDVIAEMSGSPAGTLRRISWRGRYGRGTYAVRLAGDAYELVEDADSGDTEAAILDYVTAHPGCGSTAIRDGVPGRAEEVLAMLAGLVADGRVVDGGTPTRHRYYPAQNPFPSPERPERPCGNPEPVPAVPGNGNADFSEPNRSRRPPVPVSPHRGERVGTGTPEREGER